MKNVNYKRIIFCAIVIGLFVYFVFQLNNKPPLDETKIQMQIEEEHTERPETGELKFEKK